MGAPLFPRKVVISLTPAQIPHKFRTDFAGINRSQNAIPQDHPPSQSRGHCLRQEEELPLLPNRLPGRWQTPDEKLCQAQRSIG